MAHYSPKMFDVDNIAQAKQIILTPEGSTTKERWEKETPWLVDKIIELTPLSAESTVLDYGCGIGRLAKELIIRTGCRVVGVDISPSMRALANVHVASPRFMVMPPDMIDLAPPCDLALAIWVLQHVADLPHDLRLIHQAMKPSAPLFVLNNLHRAIPTNERTWANDGVDTVATIEAVFEPTLAGGQLSDEVAPPAVVANTFWRVYTARQALQAAAE